MPSSRSITLRPLIVGVCTVAVLVLGGCTDDVAAPTLTATPGSVPVLQPGEPGDPNTTVTPSATPVASPTASAADARFYRDMIGHHAQAVVMVEAVGERFGDAQVAAIAARIKAEQAPEIRAMAQWLEARGQQVPPEATDPRLTEHSRHGGMPGMASRADLAALAEASGTQADRLFLRLMIRHHQGALTMVEEHAPNVTDPLVEALSAEIIATQSKQIAQMQQMAQRLS